MSIEQITRERPAVLAVGLEEALEALRMTQLASGEMVTYVREPGGLQYARMPLVSALVHDALGCFDPRSPGWVERSLASVDTGTRGRFVWTVVRLRRRIRGYLVWQAEVDGGWRFYGRGSGLPTDAITTASAAVALLESPGRAARARRARHAELIDALRAPDGRYRTADRPDAGFDAAVNAEVVRFLVMTGVRSTRELAPAMRFVRDEVLAAAPRSAPFSNPLCLYYSVARAWMQAGLPDREGVAADLIPRVVAMQDDSGGFGGPLGTALAVATLLELGHDGDELERGVAAVAGGRLRWGGWGHDDFLAGGHGSPAWTTALSIAAMARGGARSGGNA